MACGNRDRRKCPLYRTSLLRDVHYQWFHCIVIMNAIRAFGSNIHVDVSAVRYPIASFPDARGSMVGKGLISDVDSPP